LASSASLPRLPAPLGCVLPPAGAVSSEKSVMTAPLLIRWTHVSCAAACQNHEDFGLEDSGHFCFCLSRRMVDVAHTIHPSECAAPCGTSGNLPPYLRQRSNTLPCGGVEAVAVFDTASVLAALEPPNTISTCGDGVPLQAPSCYEVTFLCHDSATTDQSRALYVQLRQGENGARQGRSVVVYLGCFSYADLSHHAKWTARPLRMPVPKRFHTSQEGGSVDGAEARAAAACSAACADSEYFAIAARQPTMHCICTSDLHPAVWRRDRDGMNGLRRASLHPSPLADSR